MFIPAEGGSVKCLNVIFIARCATWDSNCVFLKGIDLFLVYRKKIVFNKPNNMAIIDFPGDSPSHP